MVVLAGLLWAATSHRVYHRTLPFHVLTRVFGEDDAGTVATLLRKLYSIVAFALLGVVVQLAMPRARRPELRAALIVAAFSAVIEVVQKLDGAHEGLLSNAIDVACGALGGWLGAAIFSRASSLRRYSRRPPL